MKSVDAFCIRSLYDSAALDDSLDQVRAVAIADLPVIGDVEDEDVGLRAGAGGKNWSINETYYFARRFRALLGRVEPGTFAGNQWITSVDLGNLTRGLHGGTRLNIDFTDRLDESNLTNPLSGQRLLNTRSYLDYACDCCGVRWW